MNSEQMEKRLDWLDGERKKEVEETQRIKTQLNEIDRAIASLSKRLEDLSTETSRLAATSSKIAQFDETLSKHRTEVSRQLEEAEGLRTKKESQLEALRSTDQKNLAKSIEDMKRELRRVDLVDETIEQQRSEDIRLNRELRELSTGLEKAEALLNDQNLRLVSLEEWSGQETKRSTGVQSNIASINRNVEDSRNSVDAIEDRARKLEIGFAELRASDKERSDQLDLWEEEQRMRLVDFEKQWSQWGERFDLFEKMANDIEEKIQAYDQTHRSIKQMQDQLEGLLERLERRITEVGEMHRLSEERMKQDWAAFEAEETRKWSTFKLSNEERWKEHERMHSKLADTVTELSELRVEVREDLDMLIEREARKANEILSLTKQLLQDLDRRR
jgi:DNA repair exonuclease SbcCD ATPase subunit